jgi:hypothetical protein
VIVEKKKAVNISYTNMNRLITSTLMLILGISYGVKAQTRQSHLVKHLAQVMMTDAQVAHSC